MRPLTEEWQPSADLLRDLNARFSHTVSIDLALEKFKAHNIAEGLTSRNWDLRFKAWVLADVQRYRPVGATDELGTPLGQTPGTVTPLKPGDTGYVDPEDLARAARGEE
jgi:hypothetical protein